MSRLAALALVVLGASWLQAQQRPRFAGEWAQADTSSNKPSVSRTGYESFPIGDMGCGWDAPLTIRQTQDSLFVDLEHFAEYDHQPRLHLSFALDGRVTRNRINIGNAEVVVPARAHWDGGKLAIVSTYPVPPEVGGGATEVRQVLTLDDQGHLVLKTTRPDIHGPNVVRALFTRR